jgi:hypothetical protein
VVVLLWQAGIFRQGGLPSLTTLDLRNVHLGPNGWATEGGSQGTSVPFMKEPPDPVPFPRAVCRRRLLAVARGMSKCARPLELKHLLLSPSEDLQGALEELLRSGRAPRLRRLTLLDDGGDDSVAGDNHFHSALTALAPDLVIDIQASLPPIVNN